MSEIPRARFSPSRGKKQVVIRLCLVAEDRDPPLPIIDALDVIRHPDKDRYPNQNIINLNVSYPFRPTSNSKENSKGTWDIL